jgi:hypothetical protein
MKHASNTRECSTLTLNSRYHNDVSRPQQLSMARRRDNRKAEDENRKKQHRRRGHNNLRELFLSRL